MKSAKLWMSLLALGVAFGAIPAFAATETLDGIEWSYSLWNVSQDRAAVGGATWDPASIGGAITIPSRLGGYPVTVVYSDAFKNCDHLEAVTVPASIDDIDQMAFIGCTNLKKVAILGSGTWIGCNGGDYPWDDAGCWGWWELAGAFEGCRNMEKLFVPSAWKGTDIMKHAANKPSGCSIVYFDSTQTVTFDATGGEGGSTVREYLVGVGESYWDLPLPKRAGYSFAGWWTSPSGGTQVTTATKVTTASTRTLYAHWTGNVYAVAFDSQGGTGGTASVSATYGSAMPAIDVPTRTGYTFAGYYTAVNGGGTQYYTAAGKSARSWAQASATTLYAYWTGNAYAVTLDRQSGSGGTATVSATYGSAMPAIDIPTRTGYSFGGYYTEANGSGTQYYTAAGKSARSWDKTSAMTLYAKWTANTYSVTLDRQGGTGGTASVTATFGNAMPAIDVPARTGYSFGGYYTEANGGGTQYYTAAGKSAKSWDRASATTLYAKWTANTFTITLDRQGGTGGTASVKATYGSAMPTVDVPTRTGYSFGGYYTEANGSGMQYYTAAGESARSWDKATVATLYAMWTADIVCTVTLDRQGGTGGTTSVTAIYERAMPTVDVPMLTGYTFGGYYTEANGGGMQYYTATGQSVRDWDKTSSATLYAKWTANTYALTLDRQGGTGGSASAMATYGSAMPRVDVPTRTGHAFSGYYTEANGGGTQYYTATGESTRDWDQTAATILYAHWTANKYAVTLDWQGGTGGTASVTATYGSDMPSVEIPMRTGYPFGGYYSAKNGGGTQYYTAGGESMRAWDMTSATTLYARWMTVATNLSITPPTRNFGTGGGAYAIVTSGSGTWTAETSESWITLNAASGQAGYPVAYAVEETGQAESRTGHVFVSGHLHTVTQDGKGATISPANVTFELAGGTGTIAVAVGDGVAWKAKSNCEWVGVMPANGTGPGSVTFTVAPLNEFTTRQGTLTVAGQTFDVAQNGRWLEISPVSATLDCLAHTIPVTVEARDIAEWSVTSGANWISVVDAGSGTGSGEVTLAIGENPSWGERTGTVQIGTTTFTVTQQGQTALEFSISPTSTMASEEGANGLIAVTSTPDLPWSASSQVNWLTVHEGTGAGSGSVTYSAAANPSLLSRTGTITVTPGDSTVSAKTHTVTQSAATSALSATGHEFDAEGGSFQLKVTVSDIVEWQIQNNVPWLTVAGATNRVGPATLTLTAAATDTLQPRSGTVTIAGKPFTVTQAAADSLLTPAGCEFGVEGGSCEVWVSVPDVVNWQIRNTNSWLKVVGATNRVGPVPVTLQAVANTTVYSKSGTVTIADKAFAVSQKGRGVEVGYEMKLFGADGGSDTLSILPEGNASWTAVVSDPTWITVFGSSSGTGDGEVMYIVSSFVGDETERTGTITVGDKVVYITQRAFDLSISPKSASVSGESGEGNFNVSTGSGNAWQALVADPWISLVAGNDSGTGNGTVKYRYAANDTGTARKGKILVAGEVFALQQQARPPFPEAQDAAEAATLLAGAADGRLGRQIQSVEEYDAFRAWMEGKGLDRQAVKDSPHAWISYALGAERLFGAEPAIQIDGLSVARDGVKGAENGVAMDVRVVVHDDAGEVPVDAGKVVGLFEATSDLRDWDGDAKLSATAMQTGNDGATMQFKVVPGDGKGDEAFLRLGLQEKDARKSQIISFASIGEPTWKDRVNLLALASSGGPVTFEVVSGPGKLEGNVLSFTGPGTVNVQAGQAGNDMWIPAMVTETISVAKAAQTISFAAIGAQLATNLVKLSATATSGLAVSFEVVSGPGKIEKNVLSFTGAGTVEVRAVQAGDERWLPAAATQTVTVGKQTISFAAIGEQTPSDWVELSATATSGLAVSFEVVSGPGVIEGNVLSFTGEGTVVVRAVQAGDEWWLPATVTQTVTIVSSKLYMVVDLSAGSGAEAYPVSYLEAVPAGGWTDEYKTTKLVLRRIEAGTFMMGSNNEDDNQPHQVTLTKPYYVGVFEVTQKQWELVTGSKPSYFNNAAYYEKRPVEQVSWNMIRGNSYNYNWPNSAEVDANSFMGRLRARTGLEFDLPTEAQWEYACRAGTTTDLNSGKNLTTPWHQDSAMDQVGRYRYNGGQNYSSSCDTSAGTAEVGSYLPNAWGLYDMHGNVSEWCLDWCGGLADGVTDPVGSPSGSRRVLRGGSWVIIALYCASSHWDGGLPSDEYQIYGFRLVRTLSN